MEMWYGRDSCAVQGEVVFFIPRIVSGVAPHNCQLFIMRERLEPHGGISRKSKRMTACEL
jgi:hypothetical protein